MQNLVIPRPDIIVIIQFQNAITATTRVALVCGIQVVVALLDVVTTIGFNNSPQHISGDGHAFSIRNSLVAGIVILFGAARTIVLIAAFLLGRKRITLGHNQILITGRSIGTLISTTVRSSAASGTLLEEINVCCSLRVGKLIGAVANVIGIIATTNVLQIIVFVCPTSIGILLGFHDLEVALITFQVICSVGKVEYRAKLILSMSRCCPNNIFSSCFNVQTIVTVLDCNSTRSRICIIRIAGSTTRTERTGVLQCISITC